jgi:predicted metal-dependent HD superfamily phosphohydrolase
MQADFLKVRWDALIATCDADGQSAVAHYESLVSAYSERHRTYHTLTHIAQVFTELDTVPILDPAVEWATWYHDAIYRPGAPDNESRSALLARAALGELELDAQLGERVSQLILATRAHKTDDGDSAQRLFLDADLSILGAKPEDYATYSRAVREEYRSIPNILYRRGRRTFLASMLARDSIFLTDHFRHRYEEQANANLTAELAAYRTPMRK